MMDQSSLIAAGLLDATAESEFDNITLLLADLLQAPVAMMTVFDPQGGRLFFKSAVGLAEPWASRREMPLSHSLCQIIQQSLAPLVVDDARTDDRVSDLPVIAELGLGAYIGAPIWGNDDAIVGTVCVIDHVPRKWSETEQRRIVTMAEAVTSRVRMKQTLNLLNSSRREAEAARDALLAANQQFMDLAKNVPGAIFRYVEQDDGQSLVQYMSPGCLDIWEIGADDVLQDARPLWDCIFPEDVADMQASVQRSRRTLEPWRHRWRIRTPSGRVKWLDGYGQPAPEKDGITVWNSLILDVTIEVEAQQKLNENMRLLLEANKQETIGRLAGGIAHDFNNLLVVMMGNADLMMAETPVEDHMVLAGEIRSAAERGAELTKRLLSFARRANLRPTVLDLNEAVSSMNSLIRRTLPANISVETVLMAGLWKTRADRSFLENSLLNLVVNARDAMTNGGQLTIETANVRISDDYVAARATDIDPGRYTMIAVTDTGDGMDPTVMQRIFEPFFTTKDVGKGTGLGLAMVQGFVRQSGGTIRVYSERGRGTSFKIYLPVAADDPQDNIAPGAATLTIPGRAHILLVEDQEAVRRVLRLFLQGVGFAVTEAESGDKALELVVETRPDIDAIVTDVVMPGRLQGPEMVAALRARGIDLPAIYISGYPHEANVHGNGIRPEDISLTKPVDRETLLSAVSRVIRLRRH